MKRLLLTCLLLLAFVADLRSQTSEQEIVDAARQACADLDNGEFAVGDDAVTRVDLDQDGELDVLIDEGRFACSTSATLFSPTGGAQLHSIVGDHCDVWMAQAWRLVEWGEQVVLLLAEHGSQCDGYGYQPCFEAVAWSDDGAMTVRKDREQVDE